MALDRAERGARARPRRRARGRGSASTPARSSPATRRRGRRLVTGDAVNVAARLEQAAAPGRDPARRARRIGSCATPSRSEPVEPLALKGKTEPVPAYRLLERRCRTRPGTPAHLDSPMVGRDKELAPAPAGARARGRRPHLPPVHDPRARPASGSPGWSRSSCPGSSDGATVLRGRCLSYGEGITFCPLGRDRAGRPPGSPTSTTPDGRRVQGLRRSLATRRATRSSCRTSRGAARRAGRRRGAAEETFWAIRKLLEHLGPRAAARGRVRRPPLGGAARSSTWSSTSRTGRATPPILLLCIARPELLELRAGLGRREAERDDRSCSSRCADDEAADADRRTCSATPTCPPTRRERDPRRPPRATRCSSRRCSRC